MTDHVRRILQTMVVLSAQPELRPMLAWLHTLGFRGHVTTKTRRYSTTMGALREARRSWRADGDRSEGSSEDLPWQFSGYGHAGPGDRLLVVSAAARQREERQAAREALSCEAAEDPDGSA